MFRVALFGTALFVAGVIGAGASGPQDAVQKSEPCLVIWRTAHELAPGKHPNGGLEVAIWPDGAILLSPRRDALGEHVLVGQIEPPDLRAALASIKDAGFYKLNREWVVPDSSWTTIAVRDGDASKSRSWHEYLLPGFGGDINTDTDYRAFVRSWKKTRAAIEGLAPIELRRLERGQEFRGYAVDAPEKTVWRPR